MRMRAVPKLSNGTIFNDFDRPRNQDIKGTAIFYAEYVSNGTR